MLYHFERFIVVKLLLETGQCTI